MKTRGGWNTQDMRGLFYLCWLALFLVPSCAELIQFEVTANSVDVLVSLREFGSEGGEVDVSLSISPTTGCMHKEGQHTHACLPLIQYSSATGPQKRQL